MQGEKKKAIVAFTPLEIYNAKRSSSKFLTGFTIVFIFLALRANLAKGAVSEDLRDSNKIEYKSGNLRDPFKEERMEGEGGEAKEKPPEKQMPVEIKPLPSLQIQGIIWGSDLPQAIINNKVLKIGDTIEEARITGISKDKVTVFFGNQKYDLSTPKIFNIKGLNKNTEGGKDEK